MDTSLASRSVRRAFSPLMSIGASIGLAVCTGIGPGTAAADGRPPSSSASSVPVALPGLAPDPHALPRAFPEDALSSGEIITVARVDVDALTFGATFASVLPRAATVRGEPDRHGPIAQSAEDARPSGRIGVPRPGAAHGSTAEPDSPPPRFSPSGPWLDAGGGASENARQLLAQLAEVDSHGLNAADYDLAGLRDALATLRGSAHARTGSVESLLARDALERRFDAAFTALARDLGRGAVDGRAVQSRLFRDRLDPDIDALHDALVRGELDLDSALASVAVAHPGYERLRGKMKALLAERASGIDRVAIGGSAELLPGQRHRDIMGIKARLIEIGELERRTVLTPMFDAELALAIQRFQRRHGLEAAARIDEPTREALARTVEQDLDDLALSLERWRWLPRDFGSRHVIVDLPDYRLQLIDDGRAIVDMPVVIGSRRFPTPSFSREMSYMEFNPTWTVPASITDRELIPRERRNPGHLESRQFDFLALVEGKLREIPRESVTAEDFEKKPFPYKLRQRGGPQNALGRVKFMMPNPYSIYLHDTPTKRHFALHERAYSHGCVRLADPDRLAKVLMELDGKRAGDIERVFANPLTNRVWLKTHVPTHLVYLTTRVDENGTLQRRSDVYGYDPALREALRERGLLPSEHPSVVLDASVRSSAVPRFPKPVPAAPESTAPG